MTQRLDLGYNEDQQAVAAAVERFCQTQDVAAHARDSDKPVSMALWQALAALGVFAPATQPDVGAGGALEICAICEALGHAAFPGPIAATYIAAQLLTGELADKLLAGEILVSLSTQDSEMLPHAPQAGIFLVVSTQEIYLAKPPATIASVSTLGGEVWGRATLARGQALRGTTRARIIGDIARAAQLSALSTRLIRETSDYAATRKQFGKALGDFQAISQPLADCIIAATAATMLARAASASFDAATSASDSALQPAQSMAAGALLSARRSALEAAYKCHQVYGAIGITVAGPAYHLSRRIRQVASEPPSDDRPREILLADTGLGV